MSQRVLALYQRGFSVEEIARQCQRSPGTIGKHLVNLIEHGEAIDVVRLVSQEKYDAIIEALQRVGTEMLKPVKDDLGEDYSFDEIRFVRAVIQRQHRT